MRVSLRSFEDQVDRDSDQEEGEEIGDGALRDALLDRRAADDADHRGDRQEKAGDDVDVAVEAALSERADRADDDDRGEAGTGREPLAEAEPEDQQGDDHRTAADPE